jgi:hypothetical protein
MPLVTPTQSIVDFAKAFAGERPVYAAGRKIGVIKYPLIGGDEQTVRKACSGVITLYSGETAGDPAYWMTIDPTDWLGLRKIKVSDFCLRYGIVPTWASEAQKSAAVRDPNTGAVTLPAITEGTGVIVEQMTEEEKQKLKTTLIFAGAGLLAAVILLRR